MTAIDENLILDILKNCFPEGSNVRIIHNRVQDGERHFSSDLIRLVVEYEQDSVTQRKHVAIKFPIRPDSHSHSKYIESFNVFEREISMYEKVIPLINRYLNKRLAPAHFYTTDSKVLVLEDLTVYGFESGEKLPLLNFAQAKSVMKAFADFHSASHKVHQENPNILGNLLKTCLNEVQFSSLLIWGSVPLELLRRKNETHLIRIVEAALSFFKMDDHKITAILDESNFKFIVLNHGDGRKDNFLFKHSANDVQVQFVDYQCCFWTSPAFDLIYFLTNSVSADVLEAHYDDLVDEYLHELNARLKKLECVSVYNRADFDADLKTLKFFLFLSFFGLCALVSPLTMQQLADTIVKPETDYNFMYDSCLNDEQYVRIVYGWLKYFEKSKIANEFLADLNVLNGNEK